MSKKSLKIMKYRKFALVCLIVSIPLNLFATFLLDILVVPGVLLLASFIIISFIFWRCPRCKKRLPMRFDSRDNVDEAGCPFCGMNFLYDEIDE